MCVCVCERQDGAEGAWLNESPTGGDEQAAANHIAYGHAANDDWRAEGKGECGQAGSLLKAQVGSLLRSRRVHESVCVWGVEVNRKMRITNYKRINKVKDSLFCCAWAYRCVGNDSLSQKKNGKRQKGGQEWAKIKAKTKWEVSRKRQMLLVEDRTFISVAPFKKEKKKFKKNKK